MRPVKSQDAAHRILPRMFHTVQQHLQLINYFRILEYFSLKVGYKRKNEWWYQ